MQPETAAAIRYADHDERWEPIRRDPKGKVNFPQKPERSFFDKLDALNFNPVFGIAFKTKGKCKA